MAITQLKKIKIKIVTHLASIDWMNIIKLRYIGVKFNKNNSRSNYKKRNEINLLLHSSNFF